MPERPIFEPERLQRPAFGDVGVSDRAYEPGTAASAFFRAASNSSPGRHAGSAAWFATFTPRWKMSCASSTAPVKSQSGRSWSEAW